MDTRAHTSQPALPPFLYRAPESGDVLEVHQLWGDYVLESRHFGTDHTVRLGTRLGWRWRVLGADIAWVPSPLRRLLPWLAPTWSEVSQEPTGDFVLPDEGDADDGLAIHGVAGDHQLFQFEDGQWHATVDPAWTARELVDGTWRALPAGEIAVVAGTVLVIDVGPLRFAARAVSRQQALAETPTRPDYPALASFSALAFAATLFGVVVASSPPSAEVSVMEVQDRFIELVVQRDEDDEPKRARGPEKDHKPESTADKKDKREKRKSKRPDKKRTASEQMKEDKKIAMEAGLMRELNEGALADLFSSGQLDSALVAGTKGLLGVKGGGPGGGSGLFSGGRSLGGGGDVEGIGSFGGGGPGGWGGGGDDPDFTKQAGEPLTTTGEPLTIGGLPRSAVDEVVKRHLNSIKYCYSRELVRSPDLSGKVVVKFVISGDGTVSSAAVKSSTLGSEAVEQCVSGQFMRMRFPEPSGRGIVIVSYPFLFTPG